MKSIPLFAMLFALMGCTEQKEKTLFAYISASRSGIDFSNTITENDTINVVDFQYCYNGGGVGIGDFNNDGLQDIVFTGNQVSSALYLNEGNLNFKDITTASNFSADSWVTGVSIVDIDHDGFDDIYLNVGGPNCMNDCKNLLFVNNGINAKGIPTFNEKAASYGLADGNYAQQTIFFDYDGDNDLDAYVVRNGNTTTDKNSPIPKRYLPAHLKDGLYRNDWSDAKKHPIFTDVSQEMGIDHIGFGLGAGLNDLNNDQLPDIYVSNDFLTDDLLYINKGRDSVTGTHLGFAEKSSEFLAHETYNAMGMDVADINNDAQPDIMVVDMLPFDYERQKKMLGSMNYGKYLQGQEQQYASQYAHNSLQLSNGFLNDRPLRASEVGFMSGLSSTDWSWAPLMVDFDNDGDKDMYITNGYVKDITDLDFINFSDQNNSFGTPESKLAKLKGFVKELPGIFTSNFFYRNALGANFKDVSTEWIENEPSFSNGAAYADLDLDGDLDLVVNNINDEAFLIENKSVIDQENQYLRIQLKGTVKNAKAIGAKVTIWNQGQPQTQYQSVIRGYLSSVEPILHFGLGGQKVDSLQVTWPDRKVSKQYNVTANQVLVLEATAATFDTEKTREKNLLFSSDTTLLEYEHKENIFNDYVTQQLLMRQYSKLGPCIATGNLDGNDGDEIFIGGSKGIAGQIWFQDASGKYRPKQDLDAEFEDADAVFVDLDGDSDLDLYVSSGGNEERSGSEKYQDRVYLNDGSGNFTRDENALPTSYESNACVRPTDIDGDGDIDFFIGARLTPWAYPNIPESKILINENGKFIEKSNPELSKIGMVTDAVWQDVDKDGQEELIVVGEWMPISIFKNDKGSLSAMPIKILDEQQNEISSEGWWNSIKAADFDNDGDTDFLLGNQGLNGFVKPEKNTPIHLYKNDFDQNGSPDPVLAQYFETKEGKKLLPVQTRDDVIGQLSVLKNEYLTYSDFAKTDFESLLKINDLETETLKATTFASGYLENQGNGVFKLISLPDACQVAPVNDILVQDFDKDGLLDALLVGNDFSAETHYGRFDALMGIFLKGNGNGGFEAVPSKRSGFYVPGQSHTITIALDKNGSEFILVAQNNEALRTFKIDTTYREQLGRDTGQNKPTALTKPNTK